TVDCDACGRGVDPGAELPDNLAVDRNSALENELLAVATRAEARARQDLLKPLHFSRLALRRRLRGRFWRESGPLSSLISPGLSGRFRTRRHFRTPPPGSGRPL